MAYDQKSYAEAEGRTLGVLTESLSQILAGPVAFQDTGSATTVLTNLEAEPTTRIAGTYLATGVRLAGWTRSRAEAPETLDAPVGALWVAYSTADVAARTEQFLLAARAQRLITGPVGRLSEAAERVRRDNFGVRVGLESGDELGQLSATFDHMLKGIEGRDKELVFDNVEQGFVTIDSPQRLSEERSATLSIFAWACASPLVPEPGAVRILEPSRHGKDWIRLEISDDGAGVDPEALGRAAKAMGLPHDSPEQRLAALFSHGLTTLNDASETSGRGVGVKRREV